MFLCADVSVAFEDLVTRLLDKNPATRIGWDELPQHPFWESPLPDTAMPEQPLLEAFIRDNDLAPPAQGTQSHQVIQYMVGCFRHAAGLC